MRVRAPTGRNTPIRQFAVILGTNEIASAIAVALFRKRYLTVLAQDEATPVLRRKMAFHDALFDEEVRLAGVPAHRIDTGMEVLTAAEQGGDVLITDLGLLDLIVPRPIDLLVDARMQKYQITPDLRGLARQTIGVGPGFTADGNCAAAIETLPERVGEIVRQGATLPPDGMPRLLGGRGPERFVIAPVAGRWHTPFEIGMRLFKDHMIGSLDDISLHAPFDGTLRGLVRDGTEIQAGAKVAEIDPRVRGAVWSGIDDRARAIADGVMRAITYQVQPAPLAQAVHVK